MNLYRSFGNLMEAWVSEGGQCLDSDWMGKNDEDLPKPSSDMGTNLRSESVDSGVETASSDTFYPAASYSVSTDNAEIDTFTVEREGDKLSPASISKSPVLSSPLPSSSSSSSSSSPYFLPCRAPESSKALHQKLEKTLQRTDSKCLEDSTEALTVDELVKRRPWAPILPKRHTSDSVKGRRSDSLGHRRAINPLVAMKLRRPLSMSYDKRPAQKRLEPQLKSLVGDDRRRRVYSCACDSDLGKEEGRGLSPGLSYLEQVCQMLEDFAREQMRNQAIQTLKNAPREHQVMEALNICQGDSVTAEEDLSSVQRVETTESPKNISSDPQQRKDYPRGHFRQRSASDTMISTLHLRKMNADCRGQHLSTDDLLDIMEDHEKQETTKDESNKTKKNWRLKIGSLGRTQTAVREVKGQQMQSSERNSARRRLSQLFTRNRRKTLPI